MSNSMLNIHLRFLELPKTVQEKLHSGSLTWAAAYELGRVTPDKRQEVLKRAEEEQARQLQREVADEERYLKAEQKAVEAEKNVSTLTSELDKAKQGVVDSQKLLAERTEAYRDVQREVGEVMTTKDATDKDKKAAAEKLKASEADVKGAEKAVKDAKNEVAKYLKKTNTAKERAEEIKEALEAQRKALKNKPKPVGPKEVKKAAAATEGANRGYVPLNLQDIREFFKDGAEQKEFPKVAAIFRHIRKCTDGIGTPNECIANLAVVTGEKVLPKTDGEGVKKATK